MNKTFAVPRGTSDILPDTVLLWEALEFLARKVCKSYGYKEVRTPIFEDTNLFKRSLGTTTDIVNKQLLELASSKEDQEEGYALRPEGTAAVVRSYIENDLEKKEPLSKLFYIGPMFRGERPQKGRLRQFHQIGVEVLGPNAASPLLDAEVIALAMQLLRELGVKEPQLKINSLGSKEDKARISSWLRAEFAKHTDRLCPDCRARFERNVFRVLDCKNESCRKVVAQVVKDLPLSVPSQEYFKQVQAALKSVNIPFEVSPHLVRGLDYYTHTVFEITAAGLGSQDAVGAGGRYNGLVHELGGNPKVSYGAIGFALGIERILLSLGEVPIPPANINIFVMSMKEEYQPLAFLVLQLLRKSGISADMNFAGGSMKSQMGKADKSGARFALILGEEEVKNKSVAVKDMRQSTQETVALDKIVEHIKNVLPEE
ncbi:MAG: histidine--tRNA ligase [Candidatus Omnitrophica bacterium]|nr:histidine--tRNA ligase [Candidatus Omnitrophota bacterium]MDE2222460.1 histidine--tRNA ligase [Candidatus Omnitrophota bacterium]